MGAGIKTGVNIRYDDPRAVGADRVADAATVRHLYGGPCCVVDFGTATTFDAIDSHGGAIAPGIAISADAPLHQGSNAPARRHYTVRPSGIIGTNTVHALQRGLLFG